MVFTCFVVILVPYVALLSVEMLTLENPFALMGALTWDDLRADRMRAMGSFRNPSLLGTLGCSLCCPYTSGLRSYRQNRSAGFAGVALCLGIVFCQTLADH